MSSPRPITTSHPTHHAGSRDILCWFGKHRYTKSQARSLHLAFIYRVTIVVRRCLGHLIHSLPVWTQSGASGRMRSRVLSAKHRMFKCSFCRVQAIVPTAGSFGWHVKQSSLLMTQPPVNQLKKPVRRSSKSVSLVKLCKLPVKSVAGCNNNS